MSVCWSHRMVILVALLWPAALPGQEQPSPGAADSVGWFPATFVVQPVASSGTGIDIGMDFLAAQRDTPAGSGDYSPEADAAFGYRVPIYRFRDGGAGGPALDLGLEGSLLARFALGSGLNGLLNSDFRVALPLGADFGALEATLALVHLSSHAGDNFLEATPAFEERAVSRNGVAGRVLLQVSPALRVTGGVDYNWAAVRTETVAGRLGVTLDPPPGPGRRVRPVGRLEVEATDYTTGPGITGTAGVAFPTGVGDLRLGITGHAGPSWMGQFRAFDERYLGVFLGFVPDVVARSADVDDRAN